MAKRELQEINAGSMADIAFLLLIFFLVTTTMDSDKGITRKLPPYVEEKDKVEIDIKKRNIFVVLVNRQNKILVQNEYMDIKDLRDAAKEFIENPNNDETLPIKKLKDFPEPIGPRMVTDNHVISLQNDRGTKYSTFIAVQNELAGAYNELRSKLCREVFNVNYEDLDEKNPDENEIIKMIDEVYPMKISEAEPKDIGGN